MELLELENIWKNFDNKITENTRLNKEILKRMLLSNPKKRMNLIKLKAGINIFSPFILAALVFLFDMKFHISVTFYIGLSLFMIVFTLTYLWEIQYFLLICKINFNDPVLTIKKEVTILEKYKIKTTRLRYMLVPIAMFGIFMMLFQKPVFNAESIIFFILVILVFITSVYLTFKYSIYERFRMLNREIEEIEKLELE